MKIIGIDPGYERLGIGIIEKGSGKETFIFSECFQTDPQLPYHERLFVIGEHLSTILEQHTPSHLALENVFFNTNQKTAMDVAAVRGVILYIGRKYGLDIFEYTPPQIKSAVAGSGKASKQNVATMIEHLISIPVKKRLDDEYDAIAVALTHSAIHRK